ncbi:MAG: DUF2948 family protein [Hyphomicrobiales bacterium]|nr:DUF2948 family protein [Hyphomicrobiales bacterium]
MTAKPLLKLLALDEDDLKVMSAHVQDAVGREADMAYSPADQRFVFILNRFDWAGAGGAAKFERRRSRLRFDKVRRAQLQNVTPGGAATLSLLAVRFEASDPPSGFITLVFSGAAAIRLEVECVEAELADLGAAWRTRSLPSHPDDSV